MVETGLCSGGVVAAPSAVWAGEVGPSAWGVKLASGGGVAGGIGAAPGTWGVLVVWTGAVVARHGEIWNSEFGISN